MKKIVNLIYEAAAAKRLKRVGWQILGHGEESLGEHVFMTAVIAYFLAKETAKGQTLKSKRSDPERLPDMEKVLTMAIFHDFHEARTGDLDKIATFYMSRDQDKANRDIFQGNDDELLATLEEYEQKESPEARLVYEAGILALLVELKILIERGNTHAQEWFAGNCKRLRLPEALALAADLAQTDSQDWWKDIRDTLHEEFAK